MSDKGGQSRGRKIAVHLIKFLIGIAICAVLVYKYDWRRVAGPIFDADGISIVLAWFFAVLGLAAYAAMNKISLGPLQMSLSVAHILKILFQIRFYALFLPGGANILVKWYKFSRPGGQPGQALVLMGFSRVLHLFSLLLLAAIGVWWDRNFPWPDLRWLMLAVLLLVAALLFVLMSRRMVDGITALLRTPWQALPVPGVLRVRVEKLGKLSTAFKRFSAFEIGGVLFFAVGGNLLETIQHYYIARAVGLELDIFVMAWLRGVMTLCAIVPVSLSGLGIREASLVALLVYYGVAEADAMAYSLLFYGMFLVGKGVIGGILEAWDWLVPEISPTR